MSEEKKGLFFGEIVWDDVIPGGGSGKPENIGGASLNAAVHSQRLGLYSVMLSALGRDKLGEKTWELAKGLGVEMSYVTRSKLPTCLITVEFDEKGEPQYKIPPQVSWDDIEIDDAGLSRIEREGFDLFYFGTLHQRSRKSRETLYRVLEHAGFGIVYCDVNLRDPFYDAEILHQSMAASTIVKMNDQELPKILKLVLHQEMSDLKSSMEVLLRHYGLETLIVTCGEKGAAFMTPSDWGFAPGIKVQVADTVGSGDAFSAGFLYGLCTGRGVGEACELGNKMGAFIATKKSSIPFYEKEELDML